MSGGTRGPIGGYRVTLADRLRRGRLKVSALDAAEMLTTDAAFLDDVSREFSIVDRAGLAMAVETAAYCYEGACRLHPRLLQLRARQNDLLDALQCAGELKHVLALELAKPGETDQQTADRVGDQLQSLAAAASRVPRSRVKGRKANTELRSMVRVLVNYWTLTLGRRFSQDHRWHCGGPHTDAVRFCWRVVEYLVPGQGDGLRTVAREFSSAKLRKRERPIP
jgi:hypothetical protein